MRSAIFVLLIIVTMALATLPVFFTWANRIEPTLLGLPFAFLWQIGLSFLAAFFLACWYLSDSASGALELDVSIEEKP